MKISVFSPFYKNNLKGKNIWGTGIAKRMGADPRSRVMNEGIINCWQVPVDQPPPLRSSFSSFLLRQG